MDQAVQSRKPMGGGVAKRIVELAFGGGFPRDLEHEQFVKHGGDGEPVPVPLPRVYLVGLPSSRFRADPLSDDWECWSRLLRDVAASLTRPEQEPGPGVESMWTRAEAQMMVELAWGYAGWGKGPDGGPDAMCGPTGFRNLPARYYLEVHTSAELPSGLRPYKGDWPQREREAWAQTLREIADALEADSAGTVEVNDETD